MSRITVNGRAALARLRRLISAGSPANWSTRACAKARLPLRGITILCPKISWTCTAAPSLMKSLSPTSTTAFSAADSLSGAACETCAAEAFLSPWSSAFGGPSGNAVLNLPLSRTASGYSVPEGANPLTAASPCVMAENESTSCE